ncbi:hypothetical protein [Paenarthrobacter nicotinovorans]|uniref:hypothetical protein n=1 Tax=Paenarthrobacter nicotinovorans TaxID=29320 RepID=UPI0007E779FF|nr:hypothetical protein [Paenarthrobacter nicotinovorans]
MLFGDALDEIVTGLINAGINATSEPKKLQLPGAVVEPGTMTFDLLDGDNYSAEFNVYLLTANKGTVQSLNDLQDMLTKFRSVFQVIEAEPLSLVVPAGGPDPVPGLLLTLQATITKD